MEFLIVAAAAVTLVWLVHANLDAAVARRVLPVLLGAFVLRLVIHVLVMRSGVIEYGGDNLDYEARAMEIVGYWRLEGVQFVTADEMSSLFSIAVPCNVFALVIYLCDGPAPLACTAIVALLACALCVIVHKFARLVGADERAAFRLVVVTAFMPALLLHTSDTYKDGFNAFLVVACVGIGASAARRFSLSRLVLAAGLLWCLWYVRPYMVFMCVVPLICGVLVSKAKFSVRKLVTFSALLATAMLFFGSVYDSAAIEQLQQQLDRGQSNVVRYANATGGSGVIFEDGGDAWNSLGEKLVYTVLSPFPWASGSLALHLGKIDVLLWYFLLWSAARGAVRLWRHDRRILLILLLFIVPGTIAYATTMSNIGLIFRQRIPIVLVTSLLAAVAWSRLPLGSSVAPSGATPGAPERSRTRDPRPARHLTGDPAPRR
ncbi:hypothetical protein [Nonomuraea cavernae]|uniref:Glycosyltransferase RgtA/B/C/D-like domain-containing protein n=1 Tax=Nonomuraea cavernae TaxID=2045107 RepID=A0A918DHJ4_9ACTN|nr:hypothetical protein [Nonomuraea cavernae]MCA2185159.1 hypothetical protein [Nonomuraea cavernae]GGO65590.1 hypothetical protein GCM10012289_17640 [Nonomuraea cavernae]